jgi:hypothetical protein
MNSYKWLNVKYFHAIFYRSYDLAYCDKCVNYDAKYFVTFAPLTKFNVKNLKKKLIKFFFLKKFSNMTCLKTNAADYQKRDILIVIANISNTTTAYSVAREY